MHKAGFSSFFVSLEASLKAGTALGALLLPVAAMAQADPAEASISPSDAIIVTGIRASLEDALAIRRNADVILDGVSSDDIGSTPDLNLGEALQRIPGVQISREEERRNATISVRGLPGRFTKTTVQGQSVASTARGANTGNPFGIYDSSIFNGANVIKSFTADIPSGGLAANVDLRINSALSRREGFVARAELGYEETTDAFTPSAFFSGVKRLTDNLGIYGTVAYSTQNFRRDTIRINSYNTLSAARLTELTNGITATETRLATAPNAAFNIAATDENGVVNEVLVPGEIRQFNTYNKGDRLSAGGGAEWEPIDGLSLRVDGIYTRRKLDEALLNIFTISGDDTNGVVTPLVDPQFLGQFDRNNNGTATNVYLVSQAQISDARPAIGNRSFPATDESWAIYPQLTFENDDWRVNVIGTYSKASGEVQENQFDFRVNQTTTGSVRRVDANNDGIDDFGNGVVYTVNTGSGNWNDYSLGVSIPDVLLNPENVGTETYVLSPGNTFTGQINRSFVTPGGTTRTIGIPFFATGSDRRVDRDLKSIDFEIERNLAFGPITSIIAGGFYSTEDATSLFQRNGGLGLQFDNITRDVVNLNFGADGSQGDFFGGTLDGVELDAFYSLNLDLLRSQLFPALRTPPTGVTFAPTAAQRNTLFPELVPASAQSVTYEEILRFIPSSAVGGELFPRLPLGDSGTLANNYTSSRETIELFGQTKFDFEEFGNIPVRGNIGLRWIKTDLDGQVSSSLFNFYDQINADRAARRAAGDMSAATDPLIFNEETADRPGPGLASYERFLPSANLIWDITSDIVFRAAYFETFEAFDLAEFSPSPTTVLRNEVDLEDDDAGFEASTVINVSTLDVLPRSSKAFDLGVSWYNRAGSVISLGYFQKTLENDIVRTNNFCPEGESFAIGDFSSGPLSIDGNGRCVFTNADGGAERVRINISRNVPDKITVKGWEFQVQQNFDFLPGLLQHTGGVFNYTRVRSGGDGGIRLFNVAEDVYNIIGYYDSGKVQARLAYNWQSSIQRQGGTSFSGSSTRSAPYSQLDFSGAIRPLKNLEVRFEAYNILNERREEFVGVEELGQLTSYDGRTYALSTTLRF